MREKIAKRPNLFQINLLHTLMLEAELLSAGDREGLQKLLIKTESALRQLFGPFCDYLYTLKMIRFFPRYEKESEKDMFRIWKHGVRTYIDFLNSILETMADTGLTVDDASEKLNRQIQEHMPSMFSHHQTVLDLTHKSLKADQF